MNRWDAEKAIRGSADLNPGEALLLLVLLARADNDTAIVPRRFAPSLRILAAETKVHRVTVQRWLTHLERHHWVERERSAGGAGIKTIYRLLPTGAPRRCDCRKQVHHAPNNRCIETGAEQVHSNGENRCTPTDGNEGKVVMEPENEEEIGHFRAAAHARHGHDSDNVTVTEPRTNCERPSLTLYDESACATAGCDALPRHGLLTCFDHAHDELAQRHQREAAS